jgi:hypothetical protein
MRSLLADIRRVKGSYSGENIVKAIISIFKKMINIKRLGFFISDNASFNDIIIRVILAYLRFNLKDSDFKRIKYLKYIINLIVKTFLFKKNADAFKEKS